MTDAVNVTSSAFTSDGEIPSRYTCDGEDVSPPLAWVGAPDVTAAYALIVDDPDARGCFEVFALSEPLGLSDGFSADELRAAMEGKVLASGRLTASYRRGS